MKLFNQRGRGIKTDMDTGGEILRQLMVEPGELNRFTFGGLHHLYFRDEVSALRASLASVATLTDVRTAREVRALPAPIPPQLHAGGASSGRIRTHR